MTPRPIELPQSGFEPALKLAREGRYADAFQWVHQTIANSGRERTARPAATVLAEIARLAEVAGEPGLAERALELAVSLRPRYPDLHHQLACVRLLLNKRHEARLSLEHALELNPRYTAARLELALLDAREGLIGESLDALHGLAREIPLEDQGAFQQGLKRLERAEWEDAEPLLKRALAVSDPGLQEKLDRFREHLERGEPARALQLLQEVSPRHEAYPDRHYLMGLAELELSRYDDALASFARALELNPDFHEARVQLAQALEALGESAQAEEQLGLVIGRDPTNAAALGLEAAWADRTTKDRRRRREPTSAPGTTSPIQDKQRRSRS